MGEQIAAAGSREPIGDPFWCSGPFKFRAYLYGPCAFDLYGTLEDLVEDGLVVVLDKQEIAWVELEEHLRILNRELGSEVQVE